jgi:AcrR family transcriptional regulator
MVTNTNQVTRFERKKQRTRELLKQAISELLFEQGYQGLTIQAITDRADLGYGTFYLHFEDKDEAVWEVCMDFSEAYQRDLNARLADIPYPRKEYLGFIATFEYTDNVRDLFREMFGSRGSAALIKYYQNYMAELYERNLREQRYASGLDLPHEYLAQFMSGAMLRLTTWWVETANSYTAEDMARMLFNAVYRQPPPEE